MQWWDRQSGQTRTQSGFGDCLGLLVRRSSMLPLGVLPEDLSCSIPLMASLSRLCPACRCIPPCVCSVPKWRYDTHIHSFCLPNNVPSHLHSYFFLIPLRLSIICLPTNQLLSTFHSSTTSVCEALSACSQIGYLMSGAVIPRNCYLLLLEIMLKLIIMNNM